MERARRVVETVSPQLRDAVEAKLSEQEPYYAGGRQYVGENILVEHGYYEDTMEILYVVQIWDEETSERKFVKRRTGAIQSELSRMEVRFREDLTVEGVGLRFQKALYLQRVGNPHGFVAYVSAEAQRRLLGIE